MLETGNVKQISSTRNLIYLKIMQKLSTQTPSRIRKNAQKNMKKNIVTNIFLLHSAVAHIHTVIFYK